MGVLAEVPPRSNHQPLGRIEAVDDPLILFRRHILFRLHIEGLRVALVHMIGLEDMARVHSVRVAPTHMVVAGMVARFRFAGSLSPKTAASQNNRTYCESDADDDTHHGGALRAVLWLYPFNQSNLEQRLSLPCGCSGLALLETFNPIAS